MLDEAVSARILRFAFPEVNSVDPVAYFGQVGGPYHALCYSWMFWPKIIELYGAVFVAPYEDWQEFVSERLSAPVSGERESSAELSWKGAVDSFNRFELDSFFRYFPKSFDLVPEALEQLSNVLVETWYSRLARAYPERTFSVALMDSDPDFNMGIEVTQEFPELDVPSGWDPRRRFIHRNPP